MTQETNRHLADDELERYSMGDLSEPESGGLEEHLLLCERCQQRLDETDAYVVAMRDAAAGFRRRERLVPAGPPPRSWGWTWHWGWLRLVPALAAVALLLVVVGRYSSVADFGARPPFALSLEATRGAANAAWAPADTRLLIRLDLAGLSGLNGYRLEMVNDSGVTVWHDTTAVHDAQVECRIPPSRAGVYFIRVYSPDGVLLREFGLRTRNQ